MRRRAHATRFLIQIESPARKLDMPGVKALLAETGVEIDEGYGPILVNAGLGRYVVRGAASGEAKARAEALPGISFFADARQEPTARAGRRGKGARGGWQWPAGSS
jgi:hypothetical protein